MPDSSGVTDQSQPPGYSFGHDNFGNGTQSAMSLADAFHGRNVLVTGGLGFLGSNLAIKLVRYGANVTLLDSLIPEFGGTFFNIAPIRNQVVVNISDMRDANSLDILVQGKDYIFNLAGQVSHGDSMRDPQTDLPAALRDGV